ncbi:hypothetical protein MPNT_10050 [Candidatus Methylacidithermus pantelleriae]|uniref:Uncharacterized protein n=1 Tax=Candidatus Methylacidithermus pantelleriae TaxID=2744239 RepID=A0A8J2BLY0_9BACT|nr:hypothetical protein MPNT_10050 [Candidatus Methylacidithermus pantelleriae]
MVLQALAHPYRSQNRARNSFAQSSPSAARWNSKKGKGKERFSLVGDWLSSARKGVKNLASPSWGFAYTLVTALGREALQSPGGCQTYCRHPPATTLFPIRTLLWITVVFFIFFRPTLSILRKKTLFLSPLPKGCPIHLRHNPTCRSSPIFRTRLSFTLNPLAVLPCPVPPTTSIQPKISLHPRFRGLRHIAKL